MDQGKAFWAGVGGALMISVVSGLARGLGVPLHFEMILGWMVTHQGGLGTWMTGFVFHLLAGGVFGVVYGAVFERVTRRAGASVGMKLGAVHALMAGLVFGALPAGPPGLGGAPGLFAIAYGPFAVVLLVGLHLAYGALVGHMYTPVQARTLIVARS